MRVRPVCAVLPLLIGPWSAAASAQVDARSGTQVVACDTLLAVRRIGSASDGARDPVTEPGCRRIGRNDIGPVERRAMVGGAPYECLTIEGSSSCLWVAP